MIFLVIVVLALVSIGLSLLSLRNTQKMHEVTNAKEDLSRSKILFQRDSSIHEEKGSEQNQES